jgi:hypothetical protein
MIFDWSGCPKGLDDDKDVKDANEWLMVDKIRFYRSIKK